MRISALFVVLYPVNQVRLEVKKQRFAPATCLIYNYPEKINIVFVSFRRVMKQCLNKDGNETVTNCNQLKMVAQNGMPLLTAKS